MGKKKTITTWTCKTKHCHFVSTLKGQVDNHKKIMNHSEFEVVET